MKRLYKFLYFVVSAHTGEEMVVVLPQFEGTLIQFPCTFSRFRTQPGSHVLHSLFAVWVQKYHNGIPLGIVQTVHSIRGDVQHRMLILQQKDT